MHGYGRWRPLVGPIFILAWLVAARGSTSGAITEAQPDRTAERITIVSGVRLRTSPLTAAAEITKLPLGTIVVVFDQSAAKDRIGNIEDFWYRVKTSDGISGWLFGGLTAHFSQARREEIYLHIAAERLKNENKNFSEQVALFKFLTQAIAEVKSPAITAELDLARLLALSNSLRAIPFNKDYQQPYASWIKTNETKIVYSEPGGMWLVRLECFWELEKKYHALPIGERIAWIAAQCELPGECEGDILCYFAVMSMREGTYLRLHPNGAHVVEALNSIDSLLKHFDEYKGVLGEIFHEASKEDRIELKKEIAELREALMRITSPKKNILLNQLDQLSRAIP